MIIKLSDHVKLRPQQYDWFRAYFYEEKKFFLTAAHRRFGKGVCAFMLMVSAAIRKRGIYGYFLPTIGQSRKVVWQTVGEDGTKLLERIPKKLLAKEPNHSEQMVQLVNGSIIYVSGSDNYDRWVGLNFCYVVFDEAQDTNFAAWDKFRPMITRNKGFTHFLGTPRAYTEFKKLYDNHVDDPAWFVTNLTIDDTYDQFGKRIITLDDIDSERRNGMPEELIQQEYYGSWDAAMRGAYYSKQLMQAKKENRIGRFPYNPNYPVYTSSDWGYDDATAFWFFQHYNNAIFFIDYFQDRERDLAHYVKVLKDKQREWGCRYAIHWAPHDIENHEIIAGKSRKDAARELGILFRTVDRPERKIHGIHCVRHIFPRLFFNESACELGLKHLTEYRADYDEKNKVYSIQPKRNDATHGADALQTFALGWLKAFEEGNLKRQFEIANLYGTMVW